MRWDEARRRLLGLAQKAPPRWRIYAVIALAVFLWALGMCFGAGPTLEPLPDDNALEEVRLPEPEPDVGAPPAMSEPEPDFTACALEPSAAGCPAWRPRLR